MRKFFISVFLLLLAVGLAAQSNQTIIITEAGETLKATSVDIGENTIYYQETESSPINKIEKASVILIKYADGRKWMPEAATPKQDEAVAATPALKTVSADFSDPAANALAKQKVNPDNVRFIGKTSDKPANSLLLLYGPTDESTLADANVEIKILTPEIQASRESVNIYSLPQVLLLVSNRSDNIVYVDLGDTFYICDGKSYRYYTPTATATGQSSTTGASVNLGAVAGAIGVGGAVGKMASGINVGGSSGTSSSTIVYSERILGIPPHASATLGGAVLATPPSIKNSRTGYGSKSSGGSLMTVSSGDVNLIYALTKDSQLSLGEIRDTPDGVFPEMSVLLKYAHNENMESPSTLKAYYQPKKLIGLPKRPTFIPDLPKILTNNVSPDVDNVFHVMIQQTKP